MVAFIIWSLVGILFIGLGICDFHAKQVVGFWSIIPAPEIPEIEDKKHFNRAVGWMWVIFGVLMIVLGIPLLSGQNSPYVFLSVAGIIIEIIAIMIIYTRLVIKYQKH
ncbi:MAG: hypothetical protein NC089_11075 [Bacteroides sp.]|nr:hypothetical protein [Bacteroides sp.]MCM1550360.1 hypothetical protein [Clostridium sp.]